MGNPSMITDRSSGDRVPACTRCVDAKCLPSTVSSDQPLEQLIKYSMGRRERGRAWDRAVQFDGYVGAVNQFKQREAV